jgi:hypothetical protein
MLEVLEGLLQLNGGVGGMGTEAWEWCDWEYNIGWKSCCYQHQLVQVLVLMKMSTGISSAGVSCNYRRVWSNDWWCCRTNLGIGWYKQSWNGIRFVD